jgi:hypothetical protein
MSALLEALDFDVAGVRETPDGPVIGFVERVSLTTGIIRDHLETIDSALVVDAALPLPALLDHFRDRPYVFVQTGGVLDGIVTASDLNKPLVRTYLFGLISLLEIHLGVWASVAYPGDAWQAHLPKARLAKLEMKKCERARRGQALALFECLEFGDKQTLVAKSADLRDRFGLPSRKQAEAVLGEAEKLRNILAHSQYDLVSGASWQSLIILVQRVGTMIERSDVAVEARAMERTHLGLAALW